MGRHCQGISICMSLKNQFLFLEFEINLFAFSFVESMISICKLNGRSLLKRDWLFHREFIGQHNVKRRYTVAWSDQFLMRFIGKKISIKNSLALKIECYCFVGIDLIRWMWSNLNYIISICSHLQEEERKEIMFIIFW